MEKERKRGMMKEGESWEERDRQRDKRQRDRQERDRQERVGNKKKLKRIWKIKLWTEMWSSAGSG